MIIFPTRVVAGDMGAVGLFCAIGVELLATVGLVLLAARVYERAILRIGAPVRLRGLLRGGWRDVVYGVSRVANRSRSGGNTVQTPTAT